MERHARKVPERDRISELYYAYSIDAGVDVVSSGASRSRPAFELDWSDTPNQNKIGDYYHMVSDDRQWAALAYSATFNGEQDVWFVKVGDCNSTGAHDSVDIALGTSEDCNANRIPDECEDNVSCGTCNDDGVCQPGEDCTTCSGDCITGITGCGNGVCEPSLGEDCLSCEADCGGKQKGNPRNQFCCGDGAGTNPVGCEDLRCASCSVTPADPSCCGDGTCEGVENTINCTVDCGTIGDCGNGACDPGENCESCDTDCEGRLNGKPANRFCCGNGILEGAEGDGTVCDGNP